MGWEQRRIEDIFALIDTIGSLDDTNEITSRLGDYLSRFGFSSFLISGLPAQGRRPEPHVLLNNWSLEWFARYTTQNHYRHDPVVRHCCETAGAFTWDEVPESLLAMPEARRVMDEGAEFGLAKGLTVPIHGPGDGLAAVTMGGRHMELPPQARHLVHLASLHAFSAVNRALRTEQRSETGRLLTMRERDVLRWVAEGKTLWEIGQILNISEAAATAHMARIRRKLDAQTTAQAVVEAIRRKEIGI